MKDIKMNKERDSVMQKNKGVDEEVQNPNFSFVVGMLQLLRSLTQFGFYTSRNFLLETCGTAESFFVTINRLAG